MHLTEIVIFHLHVERFIAQTHCRYCTCIFNERMWSGWQHSAVLQHFSTIYSMAWQILIYIFVYWQDFFPFKCWHWFKWMVNTVTLFFSPVFFLNPFQCPALKQLISCLLLDMHAWSYPLFSRPVNSRIK